MRIKATLDQWLVLKAVLEQGGFAQAAEYLHRSQSSVSYAIAQLQSQLGVKILQIKGRKAVLTPNGAILYHRAQNLLDSAYTLENIAKGIQSGWPTELTIVIDDPFPREVLTQALSAFSQYTQTRVQLLRLVLFLVHQEDPLKRLSFFHQFHVKTVTIYKSM